MATPRKANPQKAGRPTKYNCVCTMPSEKDSFSRAQQLRRLVLSGLPDSLIAASIGLCPFGLARWASSVPAVASALEPPEQELRVEVLRKALASRRRCATKRNRIHNSPSLRLEDSMRARMWSALKGKTSGKSLSRLGFTINELRQRLEEQFQEGMSWDNYGKWHVDHIRPCASFDQSDPKQFAECWALNNMQPLWAADNIRKGAKYAGPQR